MEESSPPAPPTRPHALVALAMLIGRMAVVPARVAKEMPLNSFTKEEED
jgi:hypothetical protein